MCGLLFQGFELHKGVEGFNVSETRPSHVGMTVGSTAARVSISLYGPVRVCTGCYKHLQYECSLA